MVTVYRRRSNVAVTFCADERLTLHGFAELHPPPDQPENVLLAAGIADSATDVEAKSNAHPLVLPLAH
jgi:hypothetical protein